MEPTTESRRNAHGAPESTTEGPTGETTTEGEGTSRTGAAEGEGSARRGAGDGGRTATASATASAAASAAPSNDVEGATSRQASFDSPAAACR